MNASDFLNALNAYSPYGNDAGMGDYLAANWVTFKPAIPPALSPGSYRRSRFASATCRESAQERMVVKVQ